MNLERLVVFDWPLQLPCSSLLMICQRTCHFNWNVSGRYARIIYLGFHSHMHAHYSRTLYWLPHSKKTLSSSDLRRFSQTGLTPTHIKVKERTKIISFEKGWPYHFDRKIRYLGIWNILIKLSSCCLFIHWDAIAKL